MKRGRKPYTPEQRAARMVEKAKLRNITVDADLIGALNVAADRLENDLGFRPTLSQTVRHLVRKVGV